jgi:YVTN family beta-propeller protein
MLASISFFPFPVAAGTALKPIPVPRDSLTMVISPDGKMLYVACQTAGTVIPIRTATNTRLKSIRVGPEPIGMVFGPGPAR